MGQTNSSSLTDNVIDLAVSSVTAVDFSAFANLTAINNLSIKGCSNVNITDVNQTLSGMIDFKAYQEAVQTTSQRVDLDQLIKQQQEMIAQSVSLTSQEMQTALHNLTKINQQIQSTVVSQCATNTTLLNNIELESCTNNNITRINQTNAAQVMQNCIMQAVQNSESYTSLKQILDQKSSIVVKDSLMSLFYIFIAIGVILLILFLGPGLAMGSVVKGLSQGPMKLMMVYVALVVVLLLTHWYMHAECSRQLKPLSFFGLFSFPPSWCRSRGAAIIGYGVLGLGTLFLIYRVSLIKAE
jgi:uncharacterized protein (DUF2344 family)